MSDDGKRDSNTDRLGGVELDAILRAVPDPGEDATGELSRSHIAHMIAGDDRTTEVGPDELLRIREAAMAFNIARESNAAQPVPAPVPAPIQAAPAPAPAPAPAAVPGMAHATNPPPVLESAPLAEPAPTSLPCTFSEPTTQWVHRSPEGPARSFDPFPAATQEEETLALEDEPGGAGAGLIVFAVVVLTVLGALYVWIAN